MGEKTMVKVFLGVLVVLLVGVSTLFVSAVQTAKTQEEVESIATTVASGTVTEVETGSYNGNEIYSVELTDGDTETDVEIDATTGEVLSVEEETGDDENETQISRANAAITEEEAKEIAVAQTGGQVTDIDTDRKYGRDAWEVEIHTDGAYADVLIDMQTGEVLAIEWETGEEDD